jgi:hypothetical protein
MCVLTGEDQLDLDFRATEIKRGLEVHGAVNPLGRAGCGVQDKDKAAKEALLLAVCARGFQSGRTIVFFRTKKQAHRAKMLFGLAQLPSAGELHGDMTQTMRLESLDRFRKVGFLFMNPASF